MSNPHRKAARAKRQGRYVPPVGLIDFLEAYDHDDLPDGAWQAMIEDGVKAYNEEFGARIDPFDGFMAYIEAKK